jgi:hypothetical protein
MKSLKKVKKINLLILIFLFFNFNSYSQQDNYKKVFGVKGTAYVNYGMTLKEAKEEALNDAQRNALREAGIGEYLKSSVILLSSNTDKNNGADFLSSEYQSQLEGAILEYKVDTFYTEKTTENLFLTTVIIDATVIKYTTKPDLNFDVKLDGIKNNYNNNDKLLFSVTTSMDSYLHLFSFIEDEATLMYPNSYENGDVLKKDKGHNFPLSRIDYVVTAENKKNEKGRLIFVFTKKQMKYFQMDASQVTTPENIYTWINSIPLDQKKVITKPILIQY